MYLNKFRIFFYIFLLYILFYLFLCVCPLWSTLPRCYFVFNILQIFEPLCRYISARLTRIMLDAQPHDQGHKLATFLLTFGHKKSILYLKEICFLWRIFLIDLFFVFLSTKDYYFSFQFLSRTGRNRIPSVQFFFRCVQILQVD